MLCLPNAWLHWAQAVISLTCTTLSTASSIPIIRVQDWAPRIWRHGPIQFPCRGAWRHPGGRSASVFFLPRDNTAVAVTTQETQWLMVTTVRVEEGVMPASRSSPAVRSYSKQPIEEEPLKLKRTSSLKEWTLNLIPKQIILVTTTGRKTTSYTFSGHSSVYNDFFCKTLSR